VLAGNKPGDEVFRAAAEAAAKAIEPMEDAQADAAFRLDLVRAVTQRALERTLA
jgi:aerobic carbon-monoxide dehydrogenase medium subunit